MADAVSFVSLAPAGEQFAHELCTYKRTDTVPEQLRLPRVVGLAAALWSWFARHEPCLATQLRASRFDLITMVPSTSGRAGEHPITQLVAGVVTGSAERYRPILATHRTDLAQREFAVERYRVPSDIRGASVLVLDDTWTTGAHAQAASAALKAARASGTAVVALGRWITPECRDHGAWLSRHRPREGCCLERP